MSAPNADRAAVAREVLTELREWRGSKYGTVEDVIAFMSEHYPAPAPAAPVTVTVRHNGRDVTWRLDGNRWRSSDDWWFPLATREGDFISRIAADARVIEGQNARIAELERERDGFEQLACSYANNADYYRRLVVQIGETLGPSAYVADDGSVTADVLCAKVPEIVVSLKRERDEARRQLETAKEWLRVAKAAMSQGEGHEVGVSAGVVGQGEIVECRSGQAKAGA